MACEQLFRDKLKERGLRLTPQRDMILATLHDIKGLASAEEIHQRLQVKTSAIDISTVYRTLDLLRRFDLVDSVRGADGEQRYELLGVHGPHLHLICQRCGRVMPLDLDRAGEMAQAILAETGFGIDLHHLSLEGICPDCRVNSEQNR